MGRRNALASFGAAVNPYDRVEAVLRQHAHQEKVRRYAALYQSALEGLAWLGVKAPRIACPVTYRVTVRPHVGVRTVPAWSLTQVGVDAYVRHYENTVGGAYVVTPGKDVHVWPATLREGHTVENGYLVAHTTTVDLDEQDRPYVEWRFLSQHHDQTLTLVALSNEAGIVFECQHGAHGQVRVDHSLWRKQNGKRPRSALAQ